MPESTNVIAALNELDAYEISLPETGKEVDSYLLKEMIEKCSLAQDAVLRIERRIRDDLSVVKRLLKYKKTEYKLAYSDKLASDDRAISAELKKAAAEMAAKEITEDMAEIESHILLLENSLEYVMSKKSDVKQKNSDAKMLYRIFNTANETMPKFMYPQMTPVIQDSYNPNHSSIEALLDGID